MATPAQIKAALEDDEREFTEAPTRRGDRVEDSRGLLESVARAPDEFVRGIPRGIANLAPVAADATDFARGRPSQTGDRMRAAMQGGPGGLPDFLNRPDSFAGRTGERFGQGLPFLAAGGPAAMMGRGAIVNIASEIAATGAGQIAEELELGGGAEFAAELGVGLLNPAGSIGRFSASKTVRTNKKVKELADRLGVSEKAILRAAEFHRSTDIDVIPGTDGTPDLGTVTRRLEEAVELFPDPNVRPSTRQSASKVMDSGLEDTPAGLAERETAMARTDDQFRRRLGGRKSAVLRSVEAEFDDLQPGGTFGQAQDSFVVSHDISSELVEQAWESVDLDSMPMVSTERLKAAARRVIKNHKLNPDQVPNEAREILKLPDKISAKELQHFRSDTMRAHRQLSRGSSTGTERAKAANAFPILKQFKAEVDALPGKGSSEYRSALEATRKHYEIFPEDSVSIRAISDINDGPKVVKKIIESKDPPGEVRTLIRALEQSPRGADPFRQAVIDELTNFGIGEKSTGSVIRRLRQKEGFYREALGDEKYGQLLKVMRQFRVAQVGRAATAAASESTGSFFSTVSGKFKWTASLLTGGVGANELADVVRHAGSMIDRTMLNKEVMREFMEQPESALILLSAPDKKTIHIWTATFDMIMARALSRRALASEAAAAARSATPDQREFEQQQAELGAGQQPNGTGQ